jgi:hypothetical protein
VDRDYTSLLPRVLRKLFPDAATREQATNILSSYGRQHGWTQLACDDCRDLLIEAEYRLTFGQDRLRAANPQKYEALEKKERERYALMPRQCAAVATVYWHGP